MANFTKTAILNTFGKMLQELPFDKITVTAIVQRCEISPNTFYYHFRDIYALLDAWIDMKQAEFINDTKGEDRWAQRMKIVLHMMKDNSITVHHLFDSLPRERLERYIFKSVEQSFRDFVRKQAEGIAVTDTVVNGVASFCCYSLLGFVLKFIWEDMSADIDSSVDNLSRIFDGTIEYVIGRSSVLG